MAIGYCPRSAAFGSRRVWFPLLPVPVELAAPARTDRREAIRAVAMLIVGSSCVPRSGAASKARCSIVRYRQLVAEVVGVSLRPRSLRRDSWPPRGSAVALCGRDDPAR